MGFFTEKDRDGDVTSIHVGRIAGVAVATLVALVLVFGSWFVVGAGERDIVFNKLSGELREADSGFHFKWPIVEGTTSYETRGQLYSTGAEGASRDLQVVHAEVAVRFHPDLGSISTIHKDIGPEYGDRVIKPAVQEVVKAVSAQYNAVQLIEERPAVKIAIVDGLRKALATSHVIVEEVSITDFDFSDEFNMAIEAKVVAQQQAEQARNRLVQVEYEAEQRVIQASADLEAANKTSQIKVVQALADAEVIRLVNVQLEQSPRYVEYLKVLRWTGVLPNTLVMGDNESSVLVGLP